jgi:hypothetical protein
MSETTGGPSAVSTTGSFRFTIDARNVGTWLPKAKRFNHATLDAAIDAALAASPRVTP